MNLSRPVSKGSAESSGPEPTVRTLSAALFVTALVGSGPLLSALPFETGRDKFIAPFAESGTAYETHWSAIFRTDLIGSAEGEITEGGYRVSGASPRFEGPSPPYRVIFHDGAAAALMYGVADGELAPFEMFRHHVLTTPYLLVDEPEVLVIGVGGGADIVNALVNGARSVRGIELDPFTVELIRERHGGFTGGLFDRDDATLVVSEGRHFLRSTEDRFDLIQLTGVDTLAALSSGAYILAENYLYTAEAFGEYLARLRPGGVLSVAAIDHHPGLGYSRHALRFGSLAFEALKRRGVARPQDHIAVVSEGQGRALFEVLVRLEPFRADEIARLERFLADEGLEPWYLPGRERAQVPAFRTLFEGAAGGGASYLDKTFLDLSAPTDDRPFFFSFYKWRHLFDHRDEIDPGHLLATGQLVLVLILGVAIVFSVGAIALPLLRSRGDARDLPGRAGFLGYFAALGAGFIFAEISFVQRFLLFLGYPTYSLTVILFSFLTAAGAGAAWSGRLPDDPRRVLPALVALLTALVIGYAVVTPPLFRALLAAPFPVRVAVTFALCAPLGAVLGTFFPYGLRLVSAFSRDFSAWAWAVNGCLSVVGSVAAIMIATTFGFQVVLALVLAIYWLGALAFVRAWGEARA